MAQDVKLTMDGTLLNWLKNAGDAVKSGEIIAEVEADKATVEVEAPADGVLVKLLAEVGDELTEGTVIAQIGAAGEASAPAAAPEPPAEAAEEPAPAEEKPTATASASVTEDGRIKASPLARNIAREKGIDLAQVQGTGPDGRIVKADVESFTPAAAPAPEEAPAVAEKAPAPAPALSGRQTYGKLPSGDDVEIIDASKMRRAIAENTVLSKQMVPHFYVTAEIDMDALMALRSQLNASLEQEGIKITVNDLIVKAVALTLRKFPNLNTHYYGDKLVRHKRVNVGIAVALPNNGLINVVSPDADRTALSAMAAHHKAMFDRAREGKIRPEDIRGATFTVSNLGAYDVEHFSAIINPPEAGILAVGSARKVPVVKPDGSLGVGTRMKATISVDHRVSDGAEGAQFMQHFRSLLENPMKLLV
ncbi:dihydrolipoamide acetyltransferase family protein [Aggregatilineales bacterium SYSU G02658]